MERPIRVFVAFSIFMLFLILITEIPKYYAHPLLIFTLLLLFLWFFVEAMIS
jgi:hypothetical protein